ncbi:MAG TPA: lipase family protein [Terriglobales bacterium]|jgi:hypothetical protein|nr:lipase family protein [Terriglobales bacterium]
MIKSHRFRLEAPLRARFVVTIAASLLIVPALLGDAEFIRAQTAASAKRFRSPATLPLTSFYDTPHPLSAGKPGELIRSESIDQYNLPYELSALRILYHSRTANGEDVAVSGVVLIPDGKPPSNGWPVIAWAHDFRGTARTCAPSLMKNLGEGPILAMYANLGYAVIATDYAGLGADGKPVLDMQANALDIMYSIPAARTAVKEIGTKWIAAGPFQGGLAAVAIAESDVRDPGYLGSIDTSGLADAQEAYDRLALSSSNYELLAVAATVKTLYPEFQISDMLQDSALPAFQHDSTTCAAEREPEFTSEMLKPSWQNNRYIKEFFSRNSPGQKPTRAPLLVITGEVDPIAPADITTKTVARMCQQGSRVLFLKYRNLDASGAMAASASDQVSWIKARFNGQPAPGNCPKSQ